MSGIRAVEVMVFGPHGFVGSLMFTAQRISIGRELSAMVRLDDPSISLKHAVLAFDGETIRLKDVGSRTGTRVNGAPVSDDPLQATDEIGVGTYTLRLSIHRANVGSSAAPQRGGGTSNLSIPTPTLEMVVPPRGPGPDYVPPEDSPSDATKERPELRRVAVKPAARKPSRSEEEEPTQINEPVRPRLAALSSSPPVEARASARPPATHRIAPKVVARQKSREPASIPVSAPVSARARQPGSDPIDELIGSTLNEHAAPDPAPLRPAPALPVVPKAAVAVVAKPLPREPAVSAAPTGRAVGAEGTQEVLPVVMSRPRDEDDDDDDDDTDFEPPFDLLAVLVRAGARAAETSEPSTVEVVQYRDDRVLSVRHIAPGESFRLPGADVACGDRGADGTFVLYPSASAGIHVTQGGVALGEEETRGLALQAKLRLVAGMQVRIDLGTRGEEILVQLVPRAAALAPPKVSLKPSVGRIAPTASSLGVHLAVAAIVTVAVLGGKGEEPADVNAGRFATIAVKELEMEPPPPKAPPEAEPPPPEDAPTLPAPPTRNRPTSHTRSEASSTRQQAAAAKQSSASTAKILSALGGSSSPSSANVAAITNLDAIPQGTGGFKVSGVVGKTPGDALRVASSSDGQVDTKSAAELGSVGKIHARSGPDVVRARVTGAPPAMQGEGHLARGDIQRVINAHIYQVQGCYERQLMKDPSLAGKISFQWVISASGAVSGVRVGQSSLHSGDVTSCIQTAIQGWMFPQPQGGSVTVTYPFSFIGN